MYPINQPLAHLLRPKCLNEFVGQEHILGHNKPLRLSLEKGQLHSMLLCGPPGTGKTSLAHLIAKSCDAYFEKLSAIHSGVKDIRVCIEKAQASKNQKFVVFIDEIHRYNKAQQDVLLPHIEDGTLIVVGATTENPSYALNNALLSRMRVYPLHPLDTTSLYRLLEKGLKEISSRLNKSIDFSEEHKNMLIDRMDGDARKLFNHLEILMNIGETEQGIVVTAELIEELLTGQVKRFDKQGNDFYDQLSALHKSIRGSDADAALYWFCRMIDGGCSPLSIGRRLIRIASEDIGLADPRALAITTDACQAYERLGSPEGELSLAQAVIFLAVASKSDATYKAYYQAMEFVKKNGSHDVPYHLKNSASLSKGFHQKKSYRNPHAHQHGYVINEHYLPEGIEKKIFYQPLERGLENKIKDKLEFLKKINSKGVYSF